MTYDFRSPIAPVIRRYLAIKQALGRRYSIERAILASLDTFLIRARLQDLTPDAFFQWIESQDRLTPTVRRNRMRTVRNLCLYRRRSRPECFVPDTSSFPRCHQPVQPYIFTEAEIAQLLALCPTLPTGRYSPHRCELYRLIIVLLFTTGLRRGELLHLTIGDYDRVHGTLMIRASKFHKSRLLPLPTDVRREVDRFLALLRSYRLPLTSDTPFLWNSYHGGHTYTAESLRYGLEVLLKRAAIRTVAGRLPRTHDFRHSFAVTALLRWYRAGVDVQAKLPFLSAYMGHVSIISTYYYLHFIEPLSTLASARFAQSYGGMITPPKSAGGLR